MLRTTLHVLAPTVMALSLGLSLAACSQSHVSCADDPPDLRCLSAAEDCCLAGAAAAPECGVGGWQCPAGTLATASCPRVDPFCAVDPPPIDAGPPRCAGPAPLCYPGFGGGSSCCLDAPVLASCVGATWSCPSAHFSLAGCGRIDPVCETFDGGVDGGPSGGLYDDCNVNSDCITTTAGCCAACGQPSASDLAAVNADRAAAYYSDVACPESRDGPVACPGCPTAPNPYLIATCSSLGIRPACMLVDLEAAPHASCGVDADCRLAAPQCCACGAISAFETIAIATSTSVDALLCDAELPCPPCVPVFEADLRAVCVAGLCQVAGG